jgi:hypothetical protein
VTNAEDVIEELRIPFGAALVQAEAVVSERGIYWRWIG